MTPKPTASTADGRAVADGFTLPHNTHWSMADAWGLSASEVQAARADKKATITYRRYVARPAPERSVPDVG